MGKNRKKFNLNLKSLFISIVAELFMVIIGGVLSMLTRFKAENHELSVQLLIWSTDIILSYSLSWFFLHWGKSKIKYFNWISWGLSIIICTILVAIITGSFETSFVAVFTAVVPLGGYLYYLLIKNKTPKAIKTKKARRKSPL